MTPSKVCALLASIGLALCAAAASAQDVDADGVPDAQDNCLTVPNAPPLDCDTDQDGYGNRCDADFNQNFFVQFNDLTGFFLPQYKHLDSGVGTNMDCSLPQGLAVGFPPSTIISAFNVTANDYKLWWSYFISTGLPGPSGCACAGLPGCGATCP
jgi:hypothetical protein